MESLMNRIQISIGESKSVKEKMIADLDLMEKVAEVSRILIDCFKNNRTVYWCGNGGSAADAQHLASELSGRFYLDRDPLPSEALHVNTSYITAVANDYGYDHIYSRYLSGCGKEGDVLIALSTSGNSKNIINAVEVAREKGMTVIGMTNAVGGELAKKAEIVLNIPSESTPRVQECHITVGHIICEIVEEKLFSNAE